MRLLEVKAYEGCNVYARFPVVRVTLDLEGLVDRETSEHPHFVNALKEMLPGLCLHQCSGDPGGFFSRLTTGTYFGHVFEHVALELQNMLGFNVRFGKTRQTDTKGVYNVVFEYVLQSTVVTIVELSHSIIMALLQRETLDLEGAMQSLQEKVRLAMPGPSTRAIMEAARQRGISVRRIGEGSMVELGTGKYARRFSATIGPSTSCLAADIACDKELTKALLRKTGVPVPHGLLVESEDAAVEAALSIPGAVVIKPCDGNQGKGVSLCLCSEEEVRNAYGLAKQHSSKVIVEEHIEGRHYRLLTVDYKVVAATERIPAHVVGDGLSTISQLIARVNENPLRGEGHEKPLTKIVEDSLVRAVLVKQGMSINSVPDEGQQVFLRESANLSTGGTAKDVTDLVHATVKEMAERASRTVGLDIAGVDIVVPDISHPMTEGAIIEVNAAPGLRMHLFPTEGQPRNVAQPIVDMVFPPGCPTEIPVVSVTGTNGKTTVVRLIAAALRKIYSNVAMTSSSGVYLNQLPIYLGDATGPLSAKQGLSQPDLDAAVLEVARGGILRDGLGYELADVAVLTNISDDHLGQEGIDSLEDMAWVKGLVAEAVRKNGWVVANAGDELCLNIARLTQRSMILFSTISNEAVSAHLSLGGRAVYAQDNKWIVFKEGDDIPFAIPLSNVPIAFDGRAIHNVENCAAAVSALWCLGVPFETMAESLREFTPGLSSNPGRQNLMYVQGVRVMVDYAHNCPGLEAVGSLARALCKGKLIGVVTAPGDRPDHAIRAFGGMAADIFDVLYLTEDQDLRGRSSGEVVALMQNGASDPSLAKECFVYTNDAEAITRALERAQGEDMVLVLYDDLQRTLTVLESIESRASRDHVVAGE